MRNGRECMWCVAIFMTVVTTFWCPHRADFKITWTFTVKTTKSEDKTLEELGKGPWQKIVADAVGLGPSQIAIESTMRRSSGQRRKLTQVVVGLAPSSPVHSSVISMLRQMDMCPPQSIIYCIDLRQLKNIQLSISNQGDEELERAITISYGRIVAEIKTVNVVNIAPGDTAAAAPAAAPSTGNSGGGVNPAVYAAIAAIVVPIGAVMYWLHRRQVVTQRQVENVMSTQTRQAAYAPSAPPPSNAPAPSAPSIPKDVLLGASQHPFNPHAVMPHGHQMVMGGAPGAGRWNV